MLLSILRHGKAEPHAPGGRDADRRLMPLGRAQAAYIGGLFALRSAPHDDPPRVVLSSEAVRARQTAELVALAIGENLRIEPGIGLGADLDTHLRIAHALAKAGRHALIVGHNPMLEALIEAIAPGEAGGKLRTGELVMVRFEGTKGIVVTRDRLVGAE